MGDPFKVSPRGWFEILNQLEPQVRDIRTEGGSGSEPALYSIAISLKRIADAMQQRVNPPYDYDEALASGEEPR